MPSHYEVSKDGRSYFDADRSMWVTFGTVPVTPTVDETEAAGPQTSAGEPWQLTDVPFIDRTDGPQPLRFPQDNLAEQRAQAVGMWRRMTPGQKIATSIFVGIAGLFCAVPLVLFVVMAFVGDYTSGTDCETVVKDVMRSTESRASGIVEVVDVEQISSLPDDFKWPQSTASKVLIAECTGTALLGTEPRTPVPIVMWKYAIPYPDTIIEWQIGDGPVVWGGVVDDSFHDE